MALTLVPFCQWWFSIFGDVGVDPQSIYCLSLSWCQIRFLFRRLRTAILRFRALLLLLLLSLRLRRFRLSVTGYVEVEELRGHFASD